MSGASWTADGRILFGQADGIYRMPSAAGAPERVIAAAEGERVFGPQLLPDGDTVLFTTTTSAAWASTSIVAQKLSGGERHVVVERGSDARYLPTGHLSTGSRSSSGWCRRGGNRRAPAKTAGSSSSRAASR